MLFPGSTKADTHTSSLVTESNRKKRKGRRGSTSLSQLQLCQLPAFRSKLGSGAEPATLPAHVQGLLSPLLGLPLFPYILAGRQFLEPPVLQLPKIPSRRVFRFRIRITLSIYLILAVNFISNYCFSFRHRTHRRRSDHAHHRRHHQSRTEAVLSAAGPH